MSGLTTFQKKSRHERYKVRDDDERRRWDSNPRALLHAYPISSRGRYDLFDTPPYISNTSYSEILNNQRDYKMLELRVRTAKYSVV